MKKFFNVNGSCNPQIHYMIDLSERLSEIKKMVDAGEYFTINRARQYGKTTLLAALAEYLKSDYKVISLDFQTISYGDFENEEKFVAAFSNEILISEYDIPEDIRSTLLHLADGKERNVTLSVLFRTLLQWCRISEKPLVLIIDEVDTATNNQVFVDFLAQLRAYYLRRMQMPTFRSVILAGVYDVRNVKSKIRPEENHKTNSPWNIAAKFKIDMNFSVDDISGMLNEYPGVKKLIYRLVLEEEYVGYNPDDKVIDMAERLGYIRVQNARVCIANRIFEMWLESERE